MKNIIKLSCVTAFVLALGVTFSQPVKAASVEETVNKLVNTVLTKIASSDQFVSKFCRKADFFSGVFSIRSGEGLACKAPEVAAMAEIICTPGNLDKYMESHCHKNAVAVLAGKDPRQVLEARITQGAGKARDLMCKKKNVLPGPLKSVSDKACAQGAAGPGAGAAAEGEAVPPAAE